jgi:hypothetical protein
MNTELEEKSVASHGDRILIRLADISKIKIKKALDTLRNLCCS